jgi:hypothetical protein
MANRNDKIIFVGHCYGSIRNMLFLQVQNINGEDMITGLNYIFNMFLCTQTMHLIYNHLCTNYVEFVIDFVGQQSKYKKN